MDDPEIDKELCESLVKHRFLQPVCNFTDPVLGPERLS